MGTDVIMFFLLMILFKSTLHHVKLNNYPMKQLTFLTLIMIALCFNVSAQYSSIALTAASDTIALGDNPKSKLTRVLSFTYDAKSEALFAQASMDVHHINPFDLPEVYVNGKLVHVNIYFPSLATSTKFYFFKVKGQQDMVVNSPVGKENAKLSFLLSPSDLIAGKNTIRITVGNRSIENVDDFAITNPKLELRGRVGADSFTDFSK
jgi:hypothetical protein